MAKQYVTDDDTPMTGFAKINGNADELYERTDGLDNGAPGQALIIDENGDPVYGQLSHGSLSNLSTDDHSIYALASGARLKVYRGTSPPSSPGIGQLWADTTTDPPTLKSYTGSDWEILSAGGGGSGSGPHTLDTHTDVGHTYDPQLADALVWGYGYVPITEVVEDFEDTDYAWPLTNDNAPDPNWLRTTDDKYKGSYSWRSPDDSSTYTSSEFNITIPANTRYTKVSIRYKVTGAPDDVYFLADTSGQSLTELFDPTSGWLYAEALLPTNQAGGTYYVNFTFGNTGPGTGAAYVDEVRLNYEVLAPSWVPEKRADYEAPLRPLTSNPGHPAVGDTWGRTDTAQPEVRMKRGTSHFRVALNECEQEASLTLANDPTPLPTGVDGYLFYGRLFTPIVSGLSLRGGTINDTDPSTVYNIIVKQGTTVLATTQVEGTGSAVTGYFDTAVPLTSGVTYDLGHSPTEDFQSYAVNVANSNAGADTSEFTLGNGTRAASVDSITDYATDITTQWTNMLALFTRTISSTVGPFSMTTASFTQPAVGSSVTVAIDNVNWYGVGSLIYLETGGYYSVASIPDSLHVSITNLGYSGNASVGGTITSPRKVSPAGLPGAQSSHRNLATLPSDVANSSGTANTFQDVTGLSFPVLAGVTYRFQFLIDFDAAATTTGSRWSLNGPTFSLLSYSARWPSSATAQSVTNANAYNSGTVSTSSSTTTGNLAVIEGIITPTANGTVVARLASEVSGSAITAKAGSTVEWWSADSNPASTIDHGGLTGLSDDDHPIYALTDGTRLRVVRATTAPSSPSAGQLWADTNFTPPQMNIYSGSAWQLFTVSGIFPAPVSISSSTTADATKRTYLVNCTSAPVTLTLPTAVGRAGKEFVVKKVDASANALTIAAAATETIDGNASINTATPGDSVVIESDSTGWQITTSPTGVTGIEERTSEPGSPTDGQQWLRRDLTPPEFHYRVSSTTYKLVFTT